MSGYDPFVGLGAEGLFDGVQEMGHVSEGSYVVTIKDLPEAHVSDRSGKASIMVNLSIQGEPMAWPIRYFIGVPTVEEWAAYNCEKGQPVATWSGLATKCNNKLSMLKRFMHAFEIPESASEPGSWPIWVGRQAHANIGVQMLDNGQTVNQITRLL